LWRLDKGIIVSKPEESTASKLNPFEPVNDTTDTPVKAANDPRTVAPIVQPRAAIAQVESPTPPTSSTPSTEEEEDYSYIDRATD